MGWEAHALSPGDLIGDPDPRAYFGEGMGRATGRGSGMVGGLYRDSKQAMAGQRLAMDRLRSYATGEQSMARQQAQRQGVQQDRAYQSLASTGQRGGRSASVDRGASLQRDTGARDLQARSVVAQQLERQAAAKAYAAAADRNMKTQMGLERTASGYTQLGIKDKDKRRRATSMMDDLQASTQARSYQDYLGNVKKDSSVSTAMGDAGLAIVTLGSNL